MLMALGSEGSYLLKLSALGPYVRGVHIGSHMYLNLEFGMSGAIIIT